VIPEQKKAVIHDLLKTLKDAKPVRSIHFPKSLRAPIAAWLARVPERVGVSDGGARFFNTHYAPFWKASGPFLLRYHAALARLWPNLPPMPFADYHSTAETDRPNTKYVCLMPGSSWPSKAWPMERFRELASIAFGKGMDVVILGTLAESGLGEAVLNGRGHNYCGQTDLRQAAALLQGAEAAIGNDSGLSHLAAACGIRTLAVYGPTNPAGSAPWGPNVTTLKLDDLTCRPCFKKICPLPRKDCMENITAEMAWKAVIGD